MTIQSKQDRLLGDSIRLIMQERNEISILLILKPLKWCNLDHTRHIYALTVMYPVRILLEENPSYFEISFLRFPFVVGCEEQ